MVHDHFPVMPGFVSQHHIVGSIISSCFSRSECQVASSVGGYGPVCKLVFNCCCRPSPEDATVKLIPGKSE